MFMFIVIINIAVNYFIWWIKLYIMSLLCYVLLPFVGFFYCVDIYYVDTIENILCIYYIMFE